MMVRGATLIVDELCGQIEVRELEHAGSGAISSLEWRCDDLSKQLVKDNQQWRHHRQMTPKVL